MRSVQQLRHFQRIPELHSRPSGSQLHWSVFGSPSETSRALYTPVLSRLAFGFSSQLAATSLTRKFARLSIVFMFRSRKPPCWFPCTRATWHRQVSLFPFTVTDATQLCAIQFKYSVSCSKVVGRNSDGVRNNLQGAEIHEKVREARVVQNDLFGNCGRILRRMAHLVHKCCLHVLAFFAVLKSLTSSSPRHYVCATSLLWCGLGRSRTSQSSPETTSPLDLQS